MLTEADTDIGSSFNVDTETDLVGSPVADAWSCTFSHRIDSRVILGARCVFDDAETVIGVFRIVAVDIIGDTRDGEWRMNVWSLRQDEKGAAMNAMTRNIWR